MTSFYWQFKVLSSCSVENGVTTNLYSHLNFNILTLGKVIRVCGQLFYIRSKYNTKRSGVPWGWFMNPLDVCAFAVDQSAPFTDMEWKLICQKHR